MSWSTISHSWCPPAWTQLSSLTTSVDVGVDFRLLTKEQYPVVTCEDRPMYTVEVYPEGTP